MILLQLRNNILHLLINCNIIDLDRINGKDGVGDAKNL